MGKKTGVVRYQSIAAWKYRLRAPYEHQTALHPTAMLTVGDSWVVLFPSGLLCLRAGYTWDGASGPTIDTKNWFRASLVHDGLYQLMRENLISKDHRRYADDLMRQILRTDGMNPIRAYYSWLAVRWFGGYCLRTWAPPPVLTAP